MGKNSGIQCFNTLHYAQDQVKKREEEKLEKAKREEQLRQLLARRRATNVAASPRPATAANVQSKEEMNEFDVQRLKGLKLLLTKKKKGQTVQEKQEEFKKIQLEQNIAKLQNELQLLQQLDAAEAEMPENEQALLQLIASNDLGDELALQNGGGLLADEASALQSPLEKSRKETEERESLLSASDRALYEKLMKQKTPSDDEMRQCSMALQLMRYNKEMKEAEKKQKTEHIAALRKIQKDRQKEKDRQSLGLELMEKSAKEALELLNRKQRERQEKQLVGEFLHRNRDALSAQSASTPGDECDLAAYYADGGDECCEDDEEGGRGEEEDDYEADEAEYEMPAAPVKRRKNANAKAPAKKVAKHGKAALKSFDDDIKSLIAKLS